jgi:putative ABC transport system permease protein
MIGNAFFLALREIRNNLMRSMLTTLGIIIGVGAVIMMVTLGNGATQSITATVASTGRNLLILSPGQRRPGTLTIAASFQIADATAIKRDVASLAAVAPVTTSTAAAVLGNHSHSTNIYGTTNDFFTAREWNIERGRKFNISEDSSGKSVCIIGLTVGKELFGAQDPIGQRMRLGKISCEVIGVLESKGKSTFGQDQDDIAVMPIRAVQRRLTGNNDVTMVWISVQNAERIDHAKGEIIKLMRERRRIGNSEDIDFQVSDMKEIGNTLSTITGTLTAFLSAIAAVSLLVGGIGIMNIMLVSVTERTREIGIRLAIGARAHDVLLQFLIEAVVISLLGGIIGVIIGISGAAGVAALLELPFVLQPGIVVIAVLFSAGVGVAFGYFPARRAARLDPIEALRHE